MSKRDNIIKWSIISIFVGLYSMVSIISTIHVIDFFRLSNPNWLAVTLAIAFEVGAAASLAAIIILDKTSRWLVWTLFIIITLMQMMGNMYYAYTHLGDYQFWSELFGINEEEPIFQKRILSLVSGAILPIVALGFIKSLVDYIRPSKVEEIKADFERTKEIEDELERESHIVNPETGEIDLSEEVLPISEDVHLPSPDYSEAEAEIHETIEDIKADENLTESEKSKKIERRIKKALLNNPDLKEKMIAEIKRIEDEDKYPKESSETPDETLPRRFGAM
jgi:hypothetical protein